MRLKRFLAILFLALLQVIGAADLYAATHNPIVSATTSTSAPSFKAAAQDQEVGSDVSFKNPHFSFHKNISEGLEDCDSKVESNVLSFQSVLLFTVRYIYYNLGLHLAEKLTYSLAMSDSFPPSYRYLLFSNFRI